MIKKDSNGDFESRRNMRGFNGMSMWFARTDQYACFCRQVTSVSRYIASLSRYPSTELNTKAFSVTCLLNYRQCSLIELTRLANCQTFLHIAAFNLLPDRLELQVRPMGLASDDLGRRRGTHSLFISTYHG